MVKTFKAFNESKQSNEDIHSICEKYGIRNYTINNDGTIDVNGYVNLSNKRLVNLPLKFRNVSGDFYCDNNKLISLEGSPQSVGGGFYCGDNLLTTLKGAPQLTNEYFSCRDNKLTSLEGAPQSVGGFNCNNNQLITLEGAPKLISLDFDCSYNKLKSLEYLPNFGGNLYFGYNPINKWFSLINYKNDQDVEAFFDFNIHCDDPDEINQEKIDQINNG